MKNFRFVLESNSSHLRFKRKTVSMPIPEDMDTKDLWEVYEELCWFLGNNFWDYADNQYGDLYEDFTVKRGKLEIPFWVEYEHCNCCGGETNVGWNDTKLEEILEEE